MKCNSVQFQQSLSLRAFLAHYCAEPSCVAALFPAHWPESFVCPARGQHGRRPRKVYQCPACQSQVSLTAGTLCAPAQLPPTPGFPTLHICLQAHHGLFSLELARQLSVSRNSAGKLRERDERTCWEVVVQLDDAYWGGERRDGQRGGRRGPSGRAFAPVAPEPRRSVRQTEGQRWAECRLASGTVARSDGTRC